MTKYKYKAVSKDGAPVNGVVEAYNEFEAVTKIKETCSVVTKITEIPESRDKSRDIHIFTPKIKEKSLSVMCSQFSIILGSGLPIIRAVGLIASQTSDKELKKILLAVAGDVAAGYRLAQSFEQRGPRLPTTFIETIRAGEESGTLDKAFDELHHYYDKSSKTHAKLISAITYPCFTIFVAVVVIIIIMTVAVPVFSRTFESMGITLPLPTKMLIALSHFTTKYGLFVLAIIVGIILGIRFWGRSERGKYALASFRLKLPIIGHLIATRNAALYASTMSTMLSAGLPMIQAVAITAKVLTNYRFSKELARTVTDVEAGKRLGESMKGMTVFPQLLTEMTSVGEETGSMEGTLRVIGDFYSNETEVASDRALSLLEPIIIVVLAVFVVFVLLSVYLPMFSMYGAI